MSGGKQATSTSTTEGGNNLYLYDGRGKPNLYLYDAGSDVWGVEGQDVFFCGRDWSWLRTAVRVTSTTPG